MYCWIAFIVVLSVGVFLIWLETAGLQYGKRVHKYDYAHVTGRACLAFAFYIWSQSLVKLSWICNQNDNVKQNKSVIPQMFKSTFLFQSLDLNQSGIYILTSKHICQNLSIFLIISCNLLL